MVLAIIVAGLSLQAVSLLLQVDLLPSRPPLWDSSSIISEQSLSGQLLYALIGYEATPTLWHVIAYTSVMLVIVSIISTRNPEHEIQ
jgi:high-affinity iron transporter